MDRIAAQGLRYTDFHSTALCSPTRAALITGRNHHSVGNGVVGEISTGFPGYNSIIPIEKGTVGTILKANGYATSWFGKGPQHTLVPIEPSRAVRSMAQRHGLRLFLRLCRRRHQPVATEPVPQTRRQIYPFQGNPSWNLETAMADEAIQHIKQLKEIAPDKPFFVYYVPRRHPRAASSDAGVDQEDQRHALVR